MIVRAEPTYTATIYIAGDLAIARQACREFCASGLCVTVEPIEFIYTGGAETGVRVGLLNYPRFPSTPEAIYAKALALAELLRDRLCQHSFSIVTPTETVWCSARSDEALGTEAEGRNTAGGPVHEGPAPTGATPILANIDPLPTETEGRRG